MKFSILVPVYNVEKYLEQCVESLLSQTYTGDYEIILVDDGSTDSSSQLCDVYAQRVPEKIRVIHKENQGLLSARDVGIAGARGEYCVFVDSDDFAERDLLQVVSEQIEKNDTPDILVYSFQYFENGKAIPRKTFIENKVYSENDKSVIYDGLIYSSAFVSLCTKVVKTEILKNDPNDYSIFYGKDKGEDWLRSVHIFTQAKSIACVNEPLYNYRTNYGSISKSFSPEKIYKQNVVHIYNHILNYLPKWNMFDEEHIEKLKQSWLNETIYTFSNFYENSKSRKDRKTVVDYDWSLFMPQGFSVSELKNQNTVQCKLYKLITQKQYLSIRVHFIKAKIYKNIVKLKVG